MTDLRPVSENLAGAPTVLGDPRERWLQERRSLITASDAAAILGVDPWRGPFAVYASKVAALDSGDSDWLAFGRDVEGAIGKAYTRRTGRPAYDLGAHVIQRHPDLPWLGSTLDRETEGSLSNPAPAVGRGPLELKAVSGMKAKEWADDPPLNYQVQVQIQLACTGAQWGSLAALIGGVQVAWKDLLRNDRFIANALPRLEEFRLRVDRRDPPEADALPGTSWALKALYADEDGETVSLTDDDEVISLVSAWERAKAARNAADAERKDAENKLRRRIGCATYAELADGSFLTLKTTNRTAYAVEETSYRSLRRWFPRLPRRR